MRGGVNDDTIHSTQVNNDSVAQRATSPVMPTATHRERKITIASGLNSSLDVSGRTTMRDRARHEADRFSPDRRRRGVTTVTWRRHTAGQLLCKTV
jgi:hypothetical protein